MNAKPFESLEEIIQQFDRMKNSNGDFFIGELNNFEARLTVTAEVMQLAKKGEGWISVKERLPDDCKLCLTRCDNCGVIIQWYKQNGIWETEYPVKEWIVTHWMPLPNPPSGEQS